MNKKSLLIILVLLIVTSVVYSQPAAQSDDKISLPAGLKPLTAENATQITELNVNDPNDLTLPTLGFDGDMAANSDWLRAREILESISTLKGADVTSDNQIGAIPLIENFVLDKDFSAANSFQAGKQVGGTEFSDLVSVAFSPDSSTLAVGDNDGQVALWDVAQETEIIKWHAYTYSPVFVAFNPDGSQLITGGYDDNDAAIIGVWDPSTGDSLKTLTNPEDYVFGLAFSPDGSLLAVSSLTSIVLWDVDAGQQIAQLDGHPESELDNMTAVTFSPDGALLAVGTVAGKVNLFDVVSQQFLVSLSGQAPADAATNTYQLGIGYVNFSPDGALLMSVDNGGQVHLWGTTADGGSVAAPEPIAASAEASATPAGTAITTTTSVSGATCSLTANSNVNLRSGPGTTFDKAGTLAGGAAAQADGQAHPSDGFTWYHLASGAWVRADLVTAGDDCSALPVTG